MNIDKPKRPQRVYNPVDYIGTQIFGFHIVEPIDKKNPPADFTWKSLIGQQMRCVCVCGSTFFGSLADIVNGRVKSCGCQNYKGYIGKRYGKLTVVGKDGAAPKYVCKCDCGTVVSVFSSSLSSGNTKSCGCLRKSRTKPKE